MNKEIKDSIHRKESLRPNKEGKVVKYYHYNPDLKRSFDQRGRLYNEELIEHYACFGDDMTEEESKTLKEHGFTKVEDTNSWLHNKEQKISIFKTSIPGHFELLKNPCSDNLWSAKPLALLPFKEIINYIEEGLG